MKVKGLIGLVCLLLISGCATQTKVSNEEKYKDVLDSYYTAISENWDVETLYAHDLNHLVSFYDDPLNTIGYYYADLDDDGSDELLIGGVGFDDVHNVVLDIYTYTNGAPKLVIQGGERSSYFVSDDQMIVNTASNSAYETCWYFMHLVKGELETVKTIKFVAESEDVYTWTIEENGTISETNETDAFNIIFEITDRAVEYDFVPFANYSK